jgi:hypothetical protein
LIGELLLYPEVLEAIRTILECASFLEDNGSVRRAGHDRENTQCRVAVYPYGDAKVDERDVRRAQR